MWKKRSLAYLELHSANIYWVPPCVRFACILRVCVSPQCIFKSSTFSVSWFPILKKALECTQDGQLGDLDSGPHPSGLACECQLVYGFSDPLLLHLLKAAWIRSSLHCAVSLWNSAIWQHFHILCMHHVTSPSLTRLANSSKSLTIQPGWKVEFREYLLCLIMPILPTRTDYLG